VELARPPQPAAALVFQAVQDVPINDFQTATLTLPVAAPGPLQSIRVAVDLDHTYIGDLVVRLLPPAALGAAPVLLHDRSGGGTDNLKVTYDAVNAPALAALKGKDPSGTWTLEVSDTARSDRGTLRSLRLEMGF
jgi:subtilisin-like proprotein convertase family protein